MSRSQSDTPPTRNIRLRIRLLLVIQTALLITLLIALPDDHGKKFLLAAYIGEIEEGRDVTQAGGEDAAE